MKKRIEYIDIAKGLGMLAVIWGHIYLVGPTNLFVYSFHIPLFFFISGMMYKNDKYDKFSKFLISRIKSLLLPYIIISIASWGMWVAYNTFLHNQEEILSPLLQTFIAQGSVGYLIHNVPLWFVTCLFAVEILYYFISKTHDIVNIIICILLSLIASILVNTSIKEIFINLPWNIDSALSAILFYSIGNIFVKRCGIESIKSFVLNKKIIGIVIWLLLLLFTLIIGLINGTVNVASNNWGQYKFCFYIVGFTGIFATLMFSNIMELSESKFVKLIVKPIKWIGGNSFYYMAFHYPLYRICNQIIARIFSLSNNDICSSVIFSLVVFVATLVVSSLAVFLVVKVLDKIK